MSETSRGGKEGGKRKERRRENVGEGQGPPPGATPSWGCPASRPSQAKRLESTVLSVLSVLSSGPQASLCSPRLSAAFGFWRHSLRGAAQSLQRLLAARPGPCTCPPSATPTLPRGSRLSAGFPSRAQPACPQEPRFTQTAPRVRHVCLSAGASRVRPCACARAHVPVCACSSACARRVCSSRVLERR